ncbi:MAG: DUF4252 domain-containing protein [Muribaculaceae bacterium]|nr:DUF4252 domain-containing protein [Muribaculaceae bacterium]
MNRIVIAIMSAYMILCSAFTAAADTTVEVDNMLQKLSDSPEVTSVYVSQSMLQSLGSINNIPVSRYRFSIENVQVYSTTNPNASEKLVAVERTYTSTPSLQILMKVNDGSNRTIIYGLPDRKEKEAFRQIFMFTKDSDNTTIVLINGQLYKYQISQLIGNTHAVSTVQ